MVDQGAQPADGGGHDRRAAGGGLERDEAERLGAARHQAHVGGPVVGRQQVVGLRVDEAHPVCEAQLGDQPVGLGQLGQPVDAARAADDEQRRSWVGHGGQRARPRP